ncbi:MAG: PAS domain-containing protein [Blastocatellia bacterium]
MFRNDQQLAGSMRHKSLRRARRLQQKSVLPRLKAQHQRQQDSLIQKQAVIHRGQDDGQVSAQPASEIGVGFGEQTQEWTGAFMQAILDATPTNLAVLDESGAILHVNKAWARYADRSGFMADRRGMNYIDAWQEVVGSTDEANEIAKGIQQILVGKETVFKKQCYCAGPLTPRWALLRAARFELAGVSKALRVLVAHEDVTSHLQAIEAMPDGEKQLRNALNRHFAFVAVLAPDGRLIEMNHAPLEAADIEQIENDGEKFWDYSWWNYDAEARARFSEACERAASGERIRCDVTVSLAEGRKVSLDFMLAPVKGDDGKVTHLVASAVDISERKSMEEALRDLSGRLISVQEAERRRIARELHDDLNQRMAILSIGLQQLDQAIPKRQSALHARIQGLWASAQETSAEIHRLSYQLHPSKLEHLGLMAAVKDFCVEVSEHQSLKIEFRHRGFPAAVPKDIALCVFRVAQESLQNAVRHSGASQCLVVLERTDQAVNLSVSDNGRGFNVGSARAAAGLGLISIRERLRLVGGEIFINSQPARGTHIAVSVPMTS